MAPIMTDLDKQDIETSQFIESYVQQHWDTNGTACYLSKLGFVLKNELPESAAVIRDGLHEYLRRHPIVKIVQHPKIYQKIGAVPLSVTVPDHVEDLFAPKVKLAASEQSTSFRQEFWDAFIKPISGKVRFVCIDDHGEIKVSDGKDADTEKNCYKILPDDLTKESRGAPVSDRVNATQKAIDAWLGKHSLDRATFAVSKNFSSKRSVGRLHDFLSIFDGFSEDDLSRISIPIDILVKLSSKK